MKFFIKKILLFFTPVYLYIISVLIIDPYNMLRDEDSLELSNLKQKTSKKVNYSLFKITKYEKEFPSAIVLGDSRSEKLSKPGNVFNLAFGGGSTQEIINTFWLAREKKTLKKVYIGINFNLYNKLNKRNMVDEAILIKDSYIRYIFNKYSFKSMQLIITALLKSSALGDINYENPSKSKKEFWKYQLTVSATNFYEFYEYPDNYYKELKKIANYCESNDIKLIFFIPPTHVELQEKIKDFNLLGMSDKFKKDLQSLGDLYDFDYPNEITRNSDNFTDPFHFNNEIKEMLENELFNEKPNVARFTKKL